MTRSMYHNYFTHTHTKMGLLSTSHLDTSAEVPGNAGHRSAPHESPQDWLGPRSEVAVAGGCGIPGGLPSTWEPKGPKEKRISTR